MLLQASLDLSSSKNSPQLYPVTITSFATLCYPLVPSTLPRPLVSSQNGGGGGGVRRLPPSPPPTTTSSTAINPKLEQKNFCVIIPQDVMHYWRSELTTVMSVPFESSPGVPFTLSAHRGWSLLTARNSIDFVVQNSLFHTPGVFIESAPKLSTVSYYPLASSLVVSRL